MPESIEPRLPDPTSRHPVIVWMGIIGTVTFAVSLTAVQSLQFNVANYSVTRVVGDRYWPASLFAGVLFVSLIGLSVWSSRSLGSRVSWPLAAFFLAPLAVNIPLASYFFSDRAPPFALTWLLILSAGWAALRAGAHLRPAPLPASAHRAALLSIALLIVSAVIVHTRIQVNYFDHFMLGHSDIGHFTEELKNCLAGRGLRSDSFDNTRLGWHFTPLLYALAPGYALCPSPLYLMVCGPLLLHLPAVPIYFLARRLSGSIRIGWLFAVAWLAHPSLSRMVYANTYGFAWVYMTIPLLAFMFAAYFTQHRRIAFLLLLLVWTCEETATAVTFGLGVTLALFTPRRKTGLVIALCSITYFLLCTELFIPHFAAAGRYERMDLFGDLGKSMAQVLGAAFTKPDVFFARLLRPQGLYLLLTLIVPMAFLPLRGRSLALAAVPTLILILLLQNTDWLSIKFWHQTTILPVLFFASVIRACATKGSDTSTKRAFRQHGEPHLEPLPQTPSPAQERGWREANLDKGSGSRSATCRGCACAVIFCATLGHYFYGFSPLTRAYQPYANDPILHTADPRLSVVQKLRLEIPDRRTVLATERMAAHFTDYRRLYTGRRIRPADLIVIDRADQWDSSGLSRRWTEFQSDPQYRLYGEYDSIIVFERQPDAPPAPPD